MYLDKLDGKLTRFPLVREPDALRYIKSGNAWFDQKEYNKAFVFMQYNGYLRRDPDLNGYNAWLTYLNAHPTDFREMVRGFMDSTEYRARF